ncbi:[ThiS-adenylate] sulfurtransferase [Alteromonadaceae bacterium Bs31]|nr:[ThiS-adenylate] sulfurtransferase [Alteromonadaceae bacterium Bs31]
MIFTVRLFPEITLKSKPVRQRWTRQLTENLRLLGRRIHEECKVIQDWDRLEVRVPNASPEDEELFVDLLGRVPGIANFSLVRAHPFETVHDIYERTYEACASELAGKTFCVRAKRTGEHSFTSIEVERYVGGGLNQNTEAAGVKLKGADVTVNIEIKGELCYIVEQKYPGLGGFPLGTQEHVLSLVSGGFDSTVASYMMMRRGLRTHYCFFNLGGKAHEFGVKEIAFYLWNRYAASHRVKFFTVPFEPVVAEILEKIGPANMGVVLKRMMLRAADRIAERGEIQAMVTGEAIAQVSSQTIPNLAAIDEVCERLVLRPLIVTHKPDIIRLSREIGAEDFSANIPEYCGVISVKPSSKVNRKKLLAQEADFDMQILEDAIASTRMQPIDAVMEDLQQTEYQVEEVAEPQAKDAIIDIRHPTEAENKALQTASEVLVIPFYRLSSAFPKLDPARRYLLYCDRGVMSNLHAAHLQDAGLRNVAVYRPAK